MNRSFKDRSEAGQLLAQAVMARHLSQPVVLALPRGGVPVALEVARALRAPLDLLLVRKIGAPDQPELAIAAVAELAAPPAGVTHELAVDAETLHYSGATRADIDQRVPQALQEIARRRALYLHGRASPTLAGKTVVVVDDGIATGTTLRAALQAVAQARPARLVVAVPVAPADTVAALRLQAQPHIDEVICLREPNFFQAVGAYYRYFDQVEDQEVIALLDKANGVTHSLPSA